MTDADVESLLGHDSAANAPHSRTSITDVGLETVGKITSLEWLSLGETAITDAGLAHLRPLINLRDLTVTNTKVSQHGADS